MYFAPWSLLLASHLTKIDNLWRVCGPPPENFALLRGGGPMSSILEPPSICLPLEKNVFLQGWRPMSSVLQPPSNSLSPGNVEYVIILEGSEAASWNYWIVAGRGFGHLILQSNLKGCYLFSARLRPHMNPREKIMYSEGFIAELGRICERRELRFTATEKKRKREKMWRAHAICLGRSSMQVSTAGDFFFIKGRGPLINTWHQHKPRLKAHYSHVMRLTVQLGIGSYFFFRRSCHQHLGLMELVGSMSSAPWWSWLWPFQSTCHLTAV